MADFAPGDEDPLPPDNGNPHPFEGNILPGEDAWIQQWADQQHFGPYAQQWHEQLAPPVQLQPDPAQHSDRTGVSRISSEEDLGSPSPVRAPPPSPVVVPSPGAVQCPLLGQPEPAPVLPLMEAGSAVGDKAIIVYTRRNRRETVMQTRDPSSSKVKLTPSSTQGLRRSLRIKKRLQGFKRATAASGSRDLPTIQTFIDISRSASPCPPLSLKSLVHTASNICGINMNNDALSSLLLSDDSDECPDQMVVGARASSFSRPLDG
ncbi:hypothetical protein GUJ93_ZPchr0001g32021 [Zizania palustris]|uniref:Uncharacterized protein n=1 Tax=Zizania palustris TaxID=103762 RepID=A0A8J5V061_ZIZPA|nr:hypothetical protein GUJ93_ZPchr0001g32021 [Zizania palustris]